MLPVNQNVTEANTHAAFVDPVNGFDARFQNRLLSSFVESNFDVPCNGDCQVKGSVTDCVV